MPVSSHTKLILLSDVVEQMCKEQNVRYVMHRSLTQVRARRVAALYVLLRLLTIVCVCVIRSVQALDSHMQLLLLLGPEEYKKQKAAKKA